MEVHLHVLVAATQLHHMHQVSMSEHFIISPLYIRGKGRVAQRLQRAANQLNEASAAAD